VNAVTPRPFVAKAQAIFTLQHWRMSPVSATAPDANQELADNDQNSWQPLQPGKLQIFADGNFAIYRITFKPVADVQKSGGQMVFKSIAGKAEVWLDKKLLAKKETFDNAPFIVAIPAGEGERTLSVLFETQPRTPAGFGGAVVIFKNVPVPIKQVKPAKPVRAAVLQTMTGGSIRLAAISAGIAGDSAEIENADTEADIGFWTNPDDRISWKVKVANPGSYHVELTCSASDNAGGGELEISVGAQKLSVTPASTSDWSDYRTIDAGAVNIGQPGEITIVVTAKSKPRDFVLNLRAVTLTDVATWNARPKQ
jgi:hypothetical protein